MIEKVNPSHPDKVADRIAGAIVDLAYNKNENPQIAVEVLIGHHECHIIIETSEIITHEEVNIVVKRIAGENLKLFLNVQKQDILLAKNQEETIRCGDNGIFKGVVLSENEKEISRIIRDLYVKYPYDGKFILTDDKFIVCQSNAKKEQLQEELKDIRKNLIINPLGDWTGGVNVDSGALIEN